ncbi:hypothetical protein [Streptomyces sp. NPDC059949]|uniref:hypothetical protein n=1 Tax=Streptomyces sp. NPDC059949 TaxID=3347013 RepID=UPI003660674F
MATLADRTETLRPTGLTPLLTTEQLQALYGVSNWTVNQWVLRGCPMEPTAFRGRRFNLDAVRWWMAELATNEAPPADEQPAPTASEQRAHDAVIRQADRLSAPPAPGRQPKRTTRAA